MLFSSLNNDSQLIDENFQNIQNIPSSSYGVERELEETTSLVLANLKIQLLNMHQ